MTCVPGAEEYLQQYRAAAQELRFLTDELERLEPACRSPSLSPVRVQGGEPPPPDALTLNAMERRERLTARRDALLALRKEIEQLVESLPDARHRELLTLHYFHGLQLWKIEEKMSYSKRQVIRLHAAALTAVAKKMAPHGTGFCGNIEPWERG